MRRPLTARDHRQDLVLAATMLVGGILSAALSSLSGMYGDEQRPLWVALIYVLVISAPLAVRRRWPAAAAVVVSVAYFVAVSARVPELYVGNIAMFITLYTVGAWMENRRAAFAVRGLIIVGMLGWLIAVVYRDAIDLAEKQDVVAGALSPYLALLMLQVLLNLLYFGGAFYFGERAWATALQRRALEQRTADLEREREVTAAQAVALERVRIARELHDVVAHHVSVMGVQAGAARLLLDPREPGESGEPGEPGESGEPGEPGGHSLSEAAAQARPLLRGIEDSARAAIGELHHLLETLRSPGGAIDEQSSTLTLDDIATLARAASEAGLQTAYTVIGEPVPVADSLAVNLYRIAQESLTNARRHAGVGATADVRVRYTDGAVELEVVNTGRPALASRPGLGMLGMRERALASGGTIELGPRDRGGWRVRVRVALGATVATA